MFFYVSGFFYLYRKQMPIYYFFKETGEISKGTEASKQSVDNLKLLFDQLKTSLKDASH